MRRSALALIALLGGCAAGGQPITDWWFDVAEGARDVPVTLPGNFARLLGLREVTYTLRAEVQLSPEQRGQSLALILDCFHGPLTLSAGGAPVPAEGDPAV